MELEFSVAKCTGCGMKVADNSFHSAGDWVPITAAAAAAAAAGCDRGRRSWLSLLQLVQLLLLVPAK
jgi:hypothetical protein